VLYKLFKLVDFARRNGDQVRKHSRSEKCLVSGW
jgi:hypothetical protein